MKGKKVVCPFCGYKQPVVLSDTAVCRGVWVRCKARHCKKEFEIQTPAKKL